MIKTRNKPRRWNLRATENHQKDNRFYITTFGIPVGVLNTTSSSVRVTTKARLRSWDIYGNLKLPRIPTLPVRSGCQEAVRRPKIMGIPGRKLAYLTDQFQKSGRIFCSMLFSSDASFEGHLGLDIPNKREGPVGAGAPRVKLP